MDTICKYTFEQYLDMLTRFHGHVAPGVLVGGFMVDAAVKRMTAYEIWDVVCESAQCLPDAVQLLTPCTIGNGWLRIVNTGRFAVTLYDKKSGDGIRVSVDASKLDGYPEIKKWFMRLVPKREQDKDALLREIRAAGTALLAIEPVTVAPALLGKHTAPRIVLCGSCGEAYPENDRGLCLACQGMDLYVSQSRTP